MRFLIIFICLFNCLKSELKSFKSVESDDKTFNGDTIVDIDYIILRQIWPASSCMFPGVHTCSISENISSWVLHGLWY